jgi:hypothetical protein
MAARTARNEHQDGADNGGPEGETPEEWPSRHRGVQTGRDMWLRA